MSFTSCAATPEVALEPACREQAHASAMHGLEGLQALMPAGNILRQAAAHMRPPIDSDITFWEGFRHSGMHLKYTAETNR